MSPTRACEPCEGTGYTGQSLLALIGILAAVALLLYVLAKVWVAFPLKHLARVAFQPGRIIITYSQVTSQLGDVLDFTYPGVFGDVIEALRPVMDLWGLLFRALGPSECFGVQGFTAKWLLRVVGLPLLLTTLVSLYYVHDRRKSGAAKARTNFKGHMFFVVFFCYPTVCIVTFAAFICRQLTREDSVLEADDSVVCEDSSHRLLQGVSVGMVVFVAFGLPLLFGVVLIKSARDYERTSAKPNAEMAKRLAKELDADVAVAEYVIRDVTIGQDYSFLMDAYKPRYLYWEAMDMIRKLVLVGLVLLVGRGSVAQLSAAIILSFAFFALQVRTRMINTHPVMININLY